MAEPFVVQLEKEKIEQLEKDLAEKDFTFTHPPYTHFQAKKKGLSLTLYTSGKLVVQGKEMKEFIEFYLEPELLQSFTYGQQKHGEPFSHIGVDESGKGDFFGPLCIAGVFATAEEIPKLIESGAKDSKKLSDKSIFKIAAQIRKNFVHHIIILRPRKYNELIGKFANLNALLGWGHATVIDYLHTKSGCKEVVIDQFASEHVVINALKAKGHKLNLVQRIRGEEDVVVAAASILARATFVEELQKLSQKIGIELPKGASKLCIETGKKIVAELGAKTLEEVGKVHFKTMTEILH